MFKVKDYLTVRGAILLMVAVVFALLGYFGSKEYEKWLIQDGRQRVGRTLVLYKNSIEPTLVRRLSLVGGLEKFVISRNDKEIARDFSVFAQGLQNDFVGVRNVGIAPAGVLSLIYPIQGNEQAVGYNFLTDETPSVKADIERTVDTGKVVLSDPFQLRQGGVGVAARKAIFKQNKLWGFVSVVLDLPTTVEDSGLENISGNLEFALRDKAGHVFWGDERVFETDPITQKISTSDGDWELGGVITGGWGAGIMNSLLIFKLVVLLVGVLLWIIIFQTLKGDVPLVIAEGSVSEQTKSLRVVVVYAFIGILWIYYSDRALLSIFANPEVINQLQTLKGWLFVIVTSFVIYWLIEVNYGKYIVTSRALRSVLACSRLLISASTTEELYQGICDVLVNEGGYRMSWVGLADKGKRIRLVSVAGVTEGFFEEVAMSLSGALGESSPCSMAITSGKAVIINDISNLNLYPEWRLSAEKRDYLSYMSVPLMEKGKAFGVLGIYSSKVNSFSNGDAEILRAFARDVSFGLHNLGRKKSESKSFLLNYQKNKKNG